MLNVLKMAWRNVWRNHRRSGITIAAMTVALIVELLYSGLVAGMIHDMEEDVVGNEMGDVQVFARGYLTKPSLYEAVENPQEILERLDAAGYAATARLYGGGLAASGEASSGVAFIGMDPVRDLRALDLGKAMAEGTWLDPGDPTGVVVGRGLARTLGLKLGSEVVLLSQAADGSMANELFTVRGILMTVAAGIDRATILMNESTFRTMMAFPDGAHKIIVRKPTEVTLDAALAVVRDIAGVPGGAAAADAANDVMTWKEISPFLAQWMASASSVITVLYFIIYVAVGILILNAMLMAVFERIREFGVLKAIGYGPGQVLVMMLAEGLYQAVVAVGLGLVLASPGMWYLSTHGINVGVLGGVQMVGMTMPTIWHGIFTVETASVPVVMLFFIVLGAVGYPALKAAWISPVEAMHSQ